MAAMAVAVGLLAVLTLLNLFILLGVVRRLRTMASDKENEAQPELPAVGATVGAFAVTSVDGTAVTEADLSSGESLVLMMSPSCQPCKETAAKLEKDRADLPERTFILLRAEPDEPELDTMLTKLAGIGTIAAFDGTAGVEDAFGSRGYPTAARIKDGVVVASSIKYADVLPDHVPA
ncbi:TlpA family protein disulfide reductase [Fodinicola feengrottensis]|uniref:Thioredoxin domain-containing protein n=1 Tax=Fodinicola feengrottensis TaxID=435914 RepID=A0ABN2HUB6_9ACTN|nr:hypothetical protein [Fodinicola feengrottensis]